MEDTAQVEDAARELEAMGEQVDRSDEDVALVLMGLPKGHTVLAWMNQWLLSRKVVIKTRLSRTYVLAQFKVGCCSCDGSADLGSRLTPTPHAAQHSHSITQVAGAAPTTEIQW